MWQPIETAPKDGRDILVMYAHNESQIVHCAYWADVVRGLDPPDEEGWWTYMNSEVARHKLEGWCAPQFWMPLPPMPDGGSPS